MKFWNSVARLGAVLIGLVLAWPGAAAVPECTTPVVEAPSGRACGVTVVTPTGRSADAFLGIPYAESVSGPNRWTPPVSKRPWTTVFPATRHGPACPQTAPAAGQTGLSAAEREDCLSLSVWRPRGTAGNARLPVMVFIHGGAFLAGSSAEPLYDGAHLAANRDVVLVSLNYRLGVFGFLATPELAGNFGFLDQQLALAWVRTNILAFGGDPDRVTIFGHSAGAMSVGLHVFSAPGSKPLFRAAIMQSNFLGIPYKRQQDQANLGRIFQRSLGCATAECLRALDAGTLLQAQNALPPTLDKVFPGPAFYLTFAPAIDGTVIQRQPMLGVQDPPGKPILLGTTHDEMNLFSRPSPLVLQDYLVGVANMFGAAFERVISRYPPAADGDNRGNWARLQTDSYLGCSTQRLARSVPSAAYGYVFARQPSFPVWGGPSCRVAGAVCHGDEVPFVFHTADRAGGRFTSEEAALSEAMMDYWTSFAATLVPTRRPGSNANAEWPRVSAEGSPYLLLDVPGPSVQSGPNRTICAFWDGVGYAVSDPWRERP